MHTTGSGLSADIINIQNKHQRTQNGSLGDPWFNIWVIWALTNHHHTLSAACDPISDPLQSLATDAIEV